MKENWYSRRGKVHRPPQVMARVQRLLELQPPEPTTDPEALRKQRRAAFEARRRNRRAAKIPIERKHLLDFDRPTA